MFNANVLPLFDPPRKMSYRAAVAKIIRDIKAVHSLSNGKLGDLLDCCGETIGNAENEETDLSAVTLLRIAYRFGEESIAPVRELYLCRHSEPLTIGDRFARIERDLAVIRKANA